MHSPLRFSTVFARVCVHLPGSFAFAYAALRLDGCLRHVFACGLGRGTGAYLGMTAVCDVLLNSVGGERDD